MDELTIYCDGLCEPSNPGGYACWAFVVLEGDREVFMDYGCLGHGSGCTNNLAEYRAVIKALEWMRDSSAVNLSVRTDSQLVVRQLLGEYAVRSPAILPLYQEALPLVRLVRPALEWIPRERNIRADALTRRAYRAARGWHPDTPCVEGRCPATAPAEAPWAEALARLDRLATSVTRFEADVLETCLRQRTWISAKQRRILIEMCQRYLPQTGLAADLAGQQQLPGVER